MRNVVLISILSIIFGFSHDKKYYVFQKEKEKLHNKEAKQLYKNAIQCQTVGDYKKSILLLNVADSIEPKNPIIIHERGLAKFNSRIDVKGAFIDLSNSIEYSIDEKRKIIRIKNRGLCYLDIGDTTSACQDWNKIGNEGEYYIKEYCK